MTQSVNALTEAMPEVTVLGSIPQWGMFVAIILGMFKLWPVLRQMTISEASELRKELQAQAHTCLEENKELRKEIASLHDKYNELMAKYNGLRAQHMAEQLGLINMLMPNLTPEMQRALQALHHIQDYSPQSVAQHVKGPVSDAEGS